MASLRLFATPRTDADSTLLTLQQTATVAAVSIDDIRRDFMLLLPIVIDRDSEGIIVE